MADQQDKTKGHVEISIEIGPAALEAVADFLIVAGSGGVVYDDGPRVVVRGYFRPDDAERVVTDLEQFLAGMPAAGLDPGPARVDTRFIPEVDWAHAWREHYRVNHVGERLVIKPSWEDYSPRPGEVVVEMDPGMAFGTGEHPTTLLCLRELDALVHDNMRVADVGTGSGILAVAAVKLGAASVFAVDNDPEAVRVARENAGRNGVADRIRVVLGDVSSLAEASEGAFNIIVMNIVADVIIPALPVLKDYMSDETVLLLSGIIDSRQGDVAAALKDHGFAEPVWKQEGEWLLAKVRR